MRTFVLAVAVVVAAMIIAVAFRYEPHASGAVFDRWHGGFIADTPCGRRYVRLGQTPPACPSFGEFLSKQPVKP